MRNGRGAARRQTDGLRLSALHPLGLAARGVSPATAGRTKARPEPLNNPDGAPARLLRPRAAGEMPQAGNRVPPQRGPFPVNPC